jgi:hypothetical protein
LECQIKVGLGIDAVSRHLKKHHSELIPEIKSMAKLHRTMVSVMESYSKSHATANVVATPSEAETRLKCSVCHRSYGLRHNFSKHVRQSKGRCAGSIAIPTAYIRTEFDGLIEMNFTQQESSPADAPPAVPPFPMIKNVLLPFMREDEDVDTYVPIFAPLFMQTDLPFEAIIHRNLQFCDSPPTADELSLKALLEMGEDWILHRARNEVSLIPGNYRASLLQLDAQDIGEVSQNLTYSFRHREENLLPVLKKLLTFLWRR